VGGDFNILRHSGEKNTKFTPLHYSNLFNTIIHSLGLREIFMHGGKYTWSNKNVVPTMKKLDRVLMSPEWEDLFPLFHVRKLVRQLSDHNALIMETREQSPLNKKSREFYFDLA
jgi:endonuclease/exonuclease/phosphatase family metal-dependent hydrolase